MTVLTPLAPLPIRSRELPLRRFTVDEYQQMIRTGILTDVDDVELLDGLIVHKMPRNPPHDAVVARLINKLLTPHLPSGWFCRGQSAIQTVSSQPEPDIAVIHGSEFDYLDHHPGPADIALVIEVADSTLVRDRDIKGPSYARAGLPVYWIVNLPGHRLEVYTDPSGPSADPSYRSRRDVGVDGTVPLVIGGQEVALIPAREIFPQPTSVTETPS